MPNSCMRSSSVSALRTFAFPAYDEPLAHSRTQRLQLTYRCWSDQESTEGTARPEGATHVDLPFCRFCWKLSSSSIFHSWIPRGTDLASSFSSSGRWVASAYFRSTYTSSLPFSISFASIIISIKLTSK